MHNTTSSELGSCIRNKKVRDKHIFKGAQVIRLEESYHRNRMSANTRKFDVLQHVRRHSERNEPTGWLLRR